MHSTISEYIMKARQDDAARAGERDRMLLEARRVRMTGRPHDASRATSGLTSGIREAKRLLGRPSVRIRAN